MTANQVAYPDHASMHQFTELHFRRSPTSDPAALYAAVKTRAQEILRCELDTSDPRAEDQAFSIYHKGHPVELSDGWIVPVTLIFPGMRQSELEAYREHIQQSWLCSQQRAQALLQACKEVWAVAEILARLHPPQDRVTLFHGVLQAMIEVTRPEALVFKHSQQVIDPADYLAACDTDPILRPGSLNVRFFNVLDSGGQMLMDTRGLTEIGLYDLQCHFRGLEPNAVVNVLRNTAVYVFEKGPVIKSGETVEGTEAGSRWLCQLETSLLEPRREILDLNPGKPWSGGDR